MVRGGGGRIRRGKGKKGRRWDDGEDREMEGVEEWEWGEEEEEAKERKRKRVSEGMARRIKRKGSRG